MKYFCADSQIFLRRPSNIFVRWTWTYRGCDLMFGDEVRAWRPAHLAPGELAHLKWRHDVNMMVSGSGLEEE